MQCQGTNQKCIPDAVIPAGDPQAGDLLVGGPQAGGPQAGGPQADRNAHPRDAQAAECHFPSQSLHLPSEWHTSIQREASCDSSDIPAFLCLDASHSLGSAPNR